MDRARELEEKKQKHFREVFDRLTTVSHTQDEHFTEHKKIEGYHEYPVDGKFFGKDRLLKRENMFGVIQMGYDPNQGKLFIFAHMKTSRYDTAAGRYQKEMKEYGQKGLLKRQGENQAYLSRRQELAAVLIERKKGKPWTKQSIKSYMDRGNMETARKLMSFFSKEEEYQELKRIREESIERQQTVRNLQVLPLETEEILEEAEEREARRQKLLSLQKEYIQSLVTENLLHSILSVKEAEARRFLTRVNYSYRRQKKEMEAWYRERKKAQERISESADTAEDGPEDETK